MAKKEFSDFQTFLTMTLVCLGAALVLACVYHFTKKPIADAEARQKEEALMIVLPTETALIEAETVKIGDKEVEIHVARDNAGKKIGYALQTISHEGYGGDIVFLLGLDSGGNINTYKIISHKETPGLGDSLMSDDFKGQFKGKNLDNFTFAVTKDKGDVQAITAATISSRAACEAIKNGLEMFEAYKKSH